MFQGLIHAWRRYRRAAKANLLRQHVDDIQIEIHRARRSKAKISLMERDARVRDLLESLEDLRIAGLELQLVSTRALLAQFEDPQKMLDEALERRTDIH